MKSSLAQEDINYLRLAGLLIKTAPRAVRQRFDYEFNPGQLQQFLSKNRRKIDDLYKNKVITQTQYGILYPISSSEVSSDMFDVSLMVCLLRHFTDLDIYDCLPFELIHTPEADISRIKFYRNYIVHSDSGEVTVHEFSEIWGCVAEAILRLVPDLKSEIDALMSATFTNASDINDLLRLEKQMEINIQHLNTVSHKLSTVSQKLSTVSQKLETLEVENKNKREICNRTLTEWRNKDKKYISTSATAYILKSLNQKRGVIITGSPGSGKSVAAHHVALSFEKDGYEIIPCDEPSEIIRHFTTEKIQVFVMDDICGKYALNQHKADSWEQNNGKLKILIESCTQKDDNEDSPKKSKTKFIITCRENIYSHKAFPKLTCFSLVQCSFSTKYKISPDEMRNIALSYVPENIVNGIENICLYDFSPLLFALYCNKAKQEPRFFVHPVEIIEQEILEMKIKSETSFLCLSLLVLNNNKFRKDKLGTSGIEHLLNAVCRDSEIESVISIVSIQKGFERLKGIYITESANSYTAIHDKMFDTISAAISPSIMNCLIEFVDIAFLAHRTQLSSCGQSSLPFVVSIPPELERSYLKRQYKEAKSGKHWEVFGSIQSENKTYRQLFLSFLNEQDTCREITYVPDDHGRTPLFVSSYLGYVDFAEYFIVKCPRHIDVKDNQGRSFFYVACENGHIPMVKYLMKFYHDINAETANKTTALSVTCLNGHSETNNLHKTINGGSVLHVACKKEHMEVVKILTDVGLNVNDTTKNGNTPLSAACQNGHYDTVKFLLDLKDQSFKSCVDTTIKDENGWSVLHVACLMGHTEVVKLLTDFGLNVNDTTNDGYTPLYAACENGHYDTVKFLLDLKDQKLQRRVDTIIEGTKGWSGLHAACLMGHMEIVKLLIDVDINVNDTTNCGNSPLYLACENGHYDTVKFLLNLKDQSFKSCVDTTIKSNGLSVLHTACFNGHTEVAQLLIDNGLNVNDTTHNGFTPLCLACYKGYYETVKYLLDLNGQTLNSRVDATIKDEQGWSALHSACLNEHTEVVKLLIDFGFNVNEITNEGFTPLYIACEVNHLDTVKFLLDLKDQTLNSRVDTTIRYKDRLSVLHAACLNGHTDLVKLLVDVGLNVNDTNNDGYTPLYLACQGGHLDTVKCLLDLNNQQFNSCVDTTIKDKDGWSVLHAACLEGHTQVVKLLIDIYMNINDKSNSSCTPLHLACQKGHYDTVKLLLNLNGQTLNSRVDATMKNEDGWSVLHSACSNGQKEIVKLLVDVGLNVNDTANYGYTPLHQACLRGDYDIVKYLLDLKDQTLNSRVDATIRDKNGWSVLHAACFNGHTDVIKLLVDIGLNVNYTTNDGCTPLLLACHRGHHDTVKFLLNINGKQINRRVEKTIDNTNRQSALHAAYSNGHTEVVKLLNDAGINDKETRTRKHYCVIL